MKTFIKTLSEGRARLKELGITNVNSFKSINQMQAAIDGAGKAPSVTIPKAVVAAPVVSTISGLKAAAASIKDPSLKVDALARVEAQALSDMNAEKDFAKKTELASELMRAQKNTAYARLAEATLSPQAAKARRFTEMID
jgi:hypothetical protein